MNLTDFPSFPNEFMILDELVGLLNEFPREFVNFIFPV